MSNTFGCGALGDLSDAWMNLVRIQLDVGRELLTSMTGVSIPTLPEQARKVSGRVLGTSCEIPPPCWMPQPLGECISHVSACKTACIRLRVTNCDRERRGIAVRAAGNDAITIDPPALVLGPMERGVVEVCLPIPDKTAQGTRFESLIWVEGCRQQYLRWTVSVGTVGLDSCHEVEVDDCPDLVHHWYDHFYCARPCLHAQGKVPGEAKVAARG